MWRCFLILFLLTTMFQSLGIADPGSFNRANRVKVDVAWLFDITPDREDTPRGRVFLVVNGRKILLRPAVVGEYHVVERTEYKDRGIPASAIAACSGWWAGAGEVLYVIRRKNQLIVYLRYIDEGISSPSDRRLKTIRLQ